MAVAKEIAQSIEKDSIIVVKSTVPIGTNDKVEEYSKKNNLIFEMKKIVIPKHFL